MSGINFNTSKRCCARDEKRRTRTRRSQHGRPSAGALLLSLLSVTHTASAQCISLKGSTACPAWPDASISAGPDMAGTFSFLSFVTDRESFDREMESYLKTTFITEKYQNQFGCGLVDFSNANDMYARFTKTTICSSIIQSSRDICGVAASDSSPVCVDTCAEFAQSEALVSADGNLCPNPGPNLIKLIRADFTTCGLPDDALAPMRCIQGIANEPENCGFADSTYGLCTYCTAGGINATDTCCFNSNVEERCADVQLPTIFPTMTFNVPTSTASPDDDSDDDDSGLSGGAIAGIVIGALVGALAIAGLLYLCIMLLRRRRQSSTPEGSVFNQPSPARRGNSMSKLGTPMAPQGYEVLPGGRIARMSALEGHSGDSPSHTNLTNAAAAGIISGRVSSRRGDNHSSSDEFDSPEFENRAGILRPPPTTMMRRGGSLSSTSALGADDPQSPASIGGLSSTPGGMTSQQSEQLPFFKDYYSQDDIHPGDRVAVLWAYQPRAADEFALERGDMLKVVGIWDDGWATGVLLDDQAEEWEARKQAQRDSGVSNTSGRRDTSPAASGEIKAFPLVCVCLPEHWKKTIDGEGSTETGSSLHQRQMSPFS